ncbi:MAG TPA: hypothetical protein PJ984_02925 [Candidatus Saccharibacteria bacterium]|nr:hypothetical protein [Candidatus Saccharibacteria bacterium]
MGILSKKKKQIAPSEDDFKLLDTSVSELSEQTSALLTHFGEINSEDSKTSKPTMPKQSSSKKTPGRSFDIIQGSNTVNLRRAKKTVTEDAPSDVIELLPEHAGKSFNEVSLEEAPKKETASSTEAPVEKTEESDDSKKVAPAVVVGHPAGSLRFDSSEDDPVELQDEVDRDAVKKDAKTDSDVEKLDAPDAKKLDDISELDANDPEKEVFRESAQPDEKPQEASLADTKHNGESKELEKSKENAMPEDEAADATEEEVQTESNTVSGEVFASNLVSNELPKGYEPPEGQQQPTVFDTNEYHPELHDWSKLDHGHGGKWYVLALLIAIAAALAYFIFSGQKLPFIS